MFEIDVIVPSHNEEGNIYELGERLVQTFSKSKISANIIFVDDHSTDSTNKIIRRLISDYNSGKICYFKDRKSINISLSEKSGPKGKASSIIQGARLGKAEYVAMIDCDLQYPPEAIPSLLSIAKEKGMAVANRAKQKTNLVRRVGSKLNILIFERFLLGLNCDSQSGLKVFKREILEYLDPKTTTSWSLDMPLLITAKDLGYEIGSYDIDFAERKTGKSKVNLVKTSIEIASTALKLKFRKKEIVEIKANEETHLGAGVLYRGKKYITHSQLSHEFTAINTFWPWQEFAAALIVTLLIGGLIFDAKLTAIIFISLLSFSYFLDLALSMFLVWRSLKTRPEISVGQKEIDRLKDSKLPIYTVLCPLYKEAGVLPDFIEAITKIDWPKDKLDVLLLLEEDDTETIKAAKDLNLPSFISTLVIPHSYPKTKPKACNYGLLHAKGEFLVIYDAEDKPDPQQLKKVYITFNNTDSRVVCLQCKLNYYNSEQNILTRFFTAEYSLWFELILPGLQSLATTIPLGGTSNHFRTSALRYLDGWDPFNVTEDCDLGVRLFKKNFLTEVVDSTTYEEANSQLKGWIKQRSRWIKGYLQTYLVHMRDPLTFYRKYGIHAFLFHMITGLRMLFTLVNPVLWLTTLSYFLFKAQVGSQIEALYPTPIFYIATLTLVIGNFFYMYINMIALAKRGQWNLIKYIPLMPVYWLYGSFAAAMAFYQLLTKPHYWEKTQHGLNLKKPVEDIAKRESIALVPSVSLTSKILAILTSYSALKLKISLPLPKSNAISKIFNFRKYYSATFINGSVLVFLTVFSNGLNFLYSAYLSRRLVVEDFGTVSFNGSLLAILGILTAGFSSAVTYKSGYLLGLFGSPVKAFWKNTFKFLRPISLLLTLIWLLIMPNLAANFNTRDILPFLLFTPILLFGFLASINTGFLYGTLKFNKVGFIIAMENLFKFALVIALVELGYSNLVYLGLSLSITLNFLLGYYFIKKIKTNEALEISAKESGLKFPKQFFTTSIIVSLSGAIFLNADVILAKHFLNPTEAGNYALLSLGGKMVFLLGSLFTQFITPIISKLEGSKQDTKLTFYKLLSICVSAALAGFVGLGVFGFKTIPFFFGAKAAAITSYLPIYTLGVACFVIGFSIIVYHQSKQQYLPAIVGFLVSLAQVIYILLFHDSIQTISYIVGVTGIIYLGNVAFIHIFYYSFEFIIRGFADFIGIFTGNTNGSKAHAGKLRILIFNWRDTKHIWAGGAEIYIQEIAKRWVNEGHKVTIFCGNDGVSTRNEKIDGVNIVRRGGFYLVYLWASLYYIFKFRGKYDVVVDCENGLPFFTPFYCSLPKVLLIHHIHQSVFREHLKFPFSTIAELMESKLMKLAYRNVKMVTVSESSKTDMKRIGLSENETIEIVHPGIDTSIFKPGIKSADPTLLYLGRLKFYKSLDTVIKSMPSVIKKHPKAVFKIAGFGEARKYLEQLTKKLDLEKHVKFLGRVTDETRLKLMQSSWVFVHPSTMEGWGISVIEANACATPVVASDVPGLRDSVNNPSSGFLVTPKNSSEFAEKINLILSDEKLRHSLSRESIKWANEFTWDRSSLQFMHVINQVLIPQGKIIFATEPNLAKQEE